MTYPSLPNNFEFTVTVNFFVKFTVKTSKSDWAALLSDFPQDPRFLTKMSRPQNKDASQGFSVRMTTKPKSPSSP